MAQRPTSQTPRPPTPLIRFLTLSLPLPLPLAHHENTSPRSASFQLHAKPKKTYRTKA